MRQASPRQWRAMSRTYGFTFWMHGNSYTTTNTQQQIHKQCKPSNGGEKNRKSKDTIVVWQGAGFATYTVTASWLPWVVY